MVSLRELNWMCCRALPRVRNDHSMALRWPALTMLAISRAIEKKSHPDRPMSGLSQWTIFAVKDAHVAILCLLGSQDVSGGPCALEHMDY